MLNKEFWQKEIVDIVTDKYVGELAFDIRTKKPVICSVIGCKNCLFGIGNEVCSEKRNKWANSEHVEKIKLTFAEKIILENLNSYFKWVARDSNGEVFCFKEKPYRGKESVMWLGVGLCRLPFSHLFKFIKWEDNKPYSIKDILNNCEVIEDGNVG